MSDFVQKHYRYNFVMNLLDGAFFTLGLAFWSSATILPLYASHLTDRPWLISLVPAIATAGWFLPQLLTARQFAGLSRRLPFVMRMTLHERWPVLALGLTMLLWPGLRPGIALAVFLALLAWQALGGGLTAPGWVDLVARVMPVNRRGRLFGMTNLLGSGMGVAGAALAGYLLSAFPYPRGFAYGFLAAGIAFALSYLFLGLIAEPAIVEVAPVQPRRSYWRSLPSILAGQPNLRRYLLARVPLVLGLAANGFLAVYAVQRFGLSDQAAGGYTAALMVASALTYPVMGFLGDRFGHKLVIEASLVVQAGSLLIALLAGRPEWFYLVFALQGMAGAAGTISTVSIVMEFGAPAERPTIVGLANTLQGFFYLAGPPLAGVIASAWGYRAAFWAALAAVVVAMVAFRAGVREPRHQGAVEVAPEVVAEAVMNERF